MAADEPDVRTLEVRGWLLRAGKHDLTARPPLCNDVAFHAQQCAEKAMKAFLVYHERPFRKTHNLTELGGAVARIEPALAELMREASLMTEFAWRFRYPGDSASVSERDALQSIELAERVLAEVRGRLPEGAWPL
jgi:HEPN domain-containing protein